MYDLNVFGDLVIFYSDSGIGETTLSNFSLPDIYSLTGSWDYSYGRNNYRLFENIDGDIDLFLSSSDQSVTKVCIGNIEDGLSTMDCVTTDKHSYYTSKGYIEDEPIFIKDGVIYIYSDGVLIDVTKNILYQNVYYLNNTFQYIDDDLFVHYDFLGITSEDRVK